MNKTVKSRKVRVPVKPVTNDLELPLQVKKLVGNRPVNVNDEGRAKIRTIISVDRVAVRTLKVVADVHFIGDKPRFAVSRREFTLNLDI